MLQSLAQVLHWTWPIILRAFGENGVLTGHACAPWWELTNKRNKLKKTEWLMDAACQPESIICRTFVSKVMFSWETAAQSPIQKQKRMFNILYIICIKIIQFKLQHHKTQLSSSIYKKLKSSVPFFCNIQVSITVRFSSNTDLIRPCFVLT